MSDTTQIKSESSRNYIVGPNYMHMFYYDKFKYINYVWITFVSLMMGHWNMNLYLET